jgi:hypothetical protein
MAGPAGRPERPGTTGVLAVGVAAFAVFCGAGLPLVVSFIGGLTLAGILGVSAGALIAAGAVIAAVIVVRSRRRRAYEPPMTAAPSSEAKR